MDLKQLVMLTLQASIILIVFGGGLKATFGDLLYVILRPGLLARSLLAVFVIMPLAAVALNRMFDFLTTVEIALMALAISPVPPILPKKQVKGGGHAPFALGLMAILALVSIVAVPAALYVLGLFVGYPLETTPGTVAGVMLKAAIAPLLAGMVLRALLPRLAERLHKPVATIGTVLLVLAVLVLLSVSLPAIWELIGNGTIFAMVAFVVAGLAIGHLLGGPDLDHSAVLALATACRHPAIALGIAATNFPDQRFSGTILLYVLLNAIVGSLYLAWQRRHAAGTTGHTATRAA